MSDFHINVEKFNKTSSDKLKGVISLFCQRLSREIIRRTPVKTGFLRGSWYATIGDGGSQEGSPDKDGSRVEGEIALALQGVQGKGETVHIKNGANYGAYVEFGTSRFAGRRMVTQSLAQAETILKGVVEELKNR